MGSKYDLEEKLMTGLIAQEVEQAALDIGYQFSGVHKADDSVGMHSISYASFVVPLVKAVQELSTQNEELLFQSEILQNRIQYLESDNQSMKRRLDEVSSSVSELKHLIQKL